MPHMKALASLVLRGPAVLAVILGLLAAPGELDTHAHGPLGLAAAEPASPELHPAGPARAASLRDYCPLCFAAGSKRGAPLAAPLANAPAWPPAPGEAHVAGLRRPRSSALLAGAPPRGPPQAA